MDKLCSIILAGGFGVRIKEIYEELPKPMVPYGGMCSLIDFSMLNCYKSGIQRVVVLTMHQRKQLIKYLLDEWSKLDNFHVDFGPFNGVHHRDIDSVLAEVQAPRENGTADALIKNFQYIFADDAEDILILHSDHVYLYDYEPMYRFHKETSAALTIGYKAIDLEDVKLFGMVKVDEESNITAFVEKCPNPDTPTIFTAVCIFNKEKLVEYLEILQKTNWKSDISKDVIPAMIKNGEIVKGYHFPEYWEDVGTKKIYYHSNMTMLEGLTSLTFDKLPHTFMKEVGRRFIEDEGRIKHSIISENTDCQGAIENSIIYPNVIIDSKANIKNSIILPNAKILGKSEIYNSIIKKDEIIKNAQVIENWKNKY